MEKSKKSTTPSRTRAAADPAAFLPPPLEELEARLAANPLGEARNIAAAALDLYSARIFWDSAYGLATGLTFRLWFSRKIPFSLAYGLDLIKLVRELAELRLRSGSDASASAMGELVRSVAELYGIGILREVLHAPLKVKDEYLGRIALLLPFDVKAFRKLCADKKKACAKKKKLLVVDRNFVVRGKSYPSLASLSRDLPELGEWLEKTVNAAYRSYGELG